MNDEEIKITFKSYMELKHKKLVNVMMEMDNLLMREKISYTDQVFLHLIQMFTLFEASKLTRNEIFEIMKPFIKRLEEKKDV